MIKVLFLGRLADVAETDAFDLWLNPSQPALLAPDCPSAVPLSFDALMANLRGSLPDALRAELADPRVKVACNGMLVDRERLQAAGGDEIAFLPPVSGGQ